MKFRVYDNQENRLIYSHHTDCRDLEFYEKDADRYIIMEYIGVEDLWGDPLYENDFYINPKGSTTPIEIVWAGGAWCSKRDGMPIGGPLGWDEEGYCGLHWMSEQVICLGCGYTNSSEQLKKYAEMMVEAYGESKTPDAELITKFCERTR